MFNGGLLDGSAGTMTVQELEAQQKHELELVRDADSPQMPTKEPPANVVKPHVLKLQGSDDGMDTCTADGVSTCTADGVAFYCFGDVCISLE